MKAAIQTAYGDASVIQLRDIEKPLPGDNDVLVRIHASSVTTADNMMRRGTPRYARLFLGLLKPRIQVPGTGFSGVVESIGANVKQYNVGDTVFGESVLSGGTNAEYVCVPENGVIAKKPESISHAEAAPVGDGPMTVSYMLNQMDNIKQGDNVLVNGAAGSLGSAAVQLAKNAGANVTAVCSERNFELVRSLGATSVVDYNQTDIATLSESYDIIYDSVGTIRYSRCKNILKKKGIYLSPVLSLPLLVSMLLSKLPGSDSRRARFAATGLLPVPVRRKMLTEISHQLDTGKIRTIIDRQFKLADIVSAHEYLESGKKRANVVLTLSDVS